MHFTLIMAGDSVYSEMENRIEQYEYCSYNEKLDAYTWDGTDEIADNSNWICDWYEIGGRWRNYFRLKKGKKRLDAASPFDKPGEVLEDRAAQCLRGDIDLRRMGKFAPFSYINNDGEYIKCPEVFEEEFKTDAEHGKQWGGGYYDVAKFTIADAKYKHEFLKWFKSIPKDEIVTLIDYHD